MSDEEKTSLTLIGTASGALICFFLMLFGLKKLYDFYSERNKRMAHDSTGVYSGGLLTTLDEGRTTSTGIEDTSGSGKGYANLESRTIAKDAKYIGETPIGKGRYGEVWKASWKGKIVAIKEFPSTDGESFTRESRIYTSLMLCHQNILTFYATDCKSVFMEDEGTKLLLITAYHQYGSLFEFLQVEKINLALALRLLQSAINGISHLHSGIVSTCEPESNRAQVKVSIAHRDIKSRNILVKDNLECCVADFGLAVKQDPNGGVDFVSEKSSRDDEPPNPRVGTRRYMAPEILDQTIQMKDFNAFQCADMYAIGLLVWEVTNVIQEDLTKEKTFYQPPFGEHVSADPNFDEMERVVCQQKIRPRQSPEWEKSQILVILSRIQRECWAEKPDSRLSILRVKKLIKTCQDLIEKDYKEKDLGIGSRIMGFYFKAEMVKLIDSVPERHSEREAVRLAEEKRLKEERERLQEEAERRRNDHLLHLQYMQSQYPIPHSPIPHYQEWNQNYYPNPHASQGHFNHVYTSTPMSHNPNITPHPTQIPNPQFQNPNFHHKFR